MLELPYRRAALRVDGSLDDWRGPVLTVQLTEPEVEPPGANRGTARLAWDLDQLWLAFEVRDNDLVPSPPGTDVTALYQYDSIEFYVDTRGNGGPRMDPGDFQFLITCSGGSVTFQGDSLLATMREIRAPKSVRPGFTFEAAAVIQPWGYQVECAIPLRAMGIADPRAGRKLRLDLAWNDWIESHPRLPVEGISLENLPRIVGGEDLSVDVLDDPEGMGLESGEAIAKRTYFAWSWSGTRDLGFPHQWPVVELVGGPTLAEIVVRRVGAWHLAFGLVAITGGTGALVLLGLESRHRRRMRAVLARLEGARVAGEGGSRPPEPASTRSRDDQLAAMLAGAMKPTATPGDEEATARAVAHIRENIKENITVADLAASLAVSPRTLQREIKRTLGCTPGELILAVKMRAAKHLLVETRLRVGEVAARVGFETPYYFSRRFKAYFHISPSELRKQSD